MSNVEILLIVGGVSAGIGGTLFLLFPYLKKIGVNLEDGFKKVETALKGADGAIKAAEVIMPENKEINTLETIDKLAQIGVNEAEQLYISSQISSDERKDKAIETAEAGLKSIGIEVTPEIKTVIDGVIEAIIYASKSKDEIKAQESKTMQNTTIALQKQVTQLTADKAQLQNTNQQLTQKLAAVKNTVAAQ